MDPLNRNVIPLELIGMILSYVEGKDAKASSEVCVSWNQVIGSNGMDKIALNTKDIDESFFRSSRNYKNIQLESTNVELTHKLLTFVAPSLVHLDAINVNHRILRNPVMLPKVKELFLKQIKWETAKSILHGIDAAKLKILAVSDLKTILELKKNFMLNCKNLKSLQLDLFATMGFLADSIHFPFQLEKFEMNSKLAIPERASDKFRDFLIHQRDSLKVLKIDRASDSIIETIMRSSKVKKLELTNLGSELTELPANKFIESLKLFTSRLRYARPIIAACPNLKTITINLDLLMLKDNIICIAESAKNLRYLKVNTFAVPFVKSQYDIARVDYPEINQKIEIVAE